MVTRERERVGREASSLGATVYPSSTNFMLLRTEIPDVAKRLKDHGVMVFDPSRQLSSEYIRVSIGTPEENDLFLSALKQVLAVS